MKNKKQKNWDIMNEMYWYYASMPSIEDWNNITNNDIKFHREQLHIQGLILDLQRAIEKFKDK
tara:strand:- start:42 stop:230 length:189 start_codon:yes stop_codon:yes gene_type:complete